MLEVAKHDGRGRRLAEPGEREALLAAYQTSGMTQRAFAAREGVNPFTLATWLRKRRLGAANGAARGEQKFVEVAVPPGPENRFSLEVVMADGLVARGNDGRQLAALVRGLR